MPFAVGAIVVLGAIGGAYSLLELLNKKHAEEKSKKER